ncbi:hypothetical protein [Mycobacterium aquaticum]|uniref:hypothetical protein n=1 Tax=Mycobacterium aquaticum TaxID=1927124 RepID=UPI001FE726D8|nr:hypothetical protein [Mycobacterium aquaticum]
MTLRVTSASRISVEQLWGTALPAVLGELIACGYAVAGSSSADVDGGGTFAARYRVLPGPATLVADVGGHEDRAIEFTLTGAALGKRAAGQDADRAIWTRLVVLATKLYQAHRVDARVIDPDVEDPPGPGASPEPVY